MKCVKWCISLVLCIFTGFTFGIVDDFLHDFEAVECHAESQTHFRAEDYLIPLTENAKSRSEVITVGFLSSYVSSKMALGAVPVAVQVVNRDANLLPNHTLQFVAVDVGHDDGSAQFSALALRKMTELRDSGAVAFIGPDEKCATEALVAAAWNIPLITFKCTDTSVSNKSIYHTFARTLPPSSMISKSVIALLDHFGWNKVILVVSNRPEWLQVLEAIQNLAPSKNINVTDIIFVDGGYIPSQFPFFQKVASETYSRTRVYLFVGDHVALVDLVRALDALGVLRTGEYAVVSVDDAIYDPGVFNDEYISRNYLDPFLGEQADLTQAFRAVLKVTASQPRRSDYKELQELIRNASAQEPFCVPYHPEIFPDIEVPIYAAYAYDAVWLYAKALTDALSEGLDPRNGSAVVSRLRNTTYQSILGFDVYMDENGDAEGNYTVVAMLRDTHNADNWTMQPVAYFIYNRSSDLLPTLRYFDPEVRIPWILGYAPEAEPVCGFGGQRCKFDPDWRVIVFCCLFIVFVAIGLVIVLRHYHYERKLARLLWKVDLRNVILLNAQYAYATASQRSLASFPVGILGPFRKSSSSMSSLTTSLESWNVFNSGNRAWEPSECQTSLGVEPTIRKTYTTVGLFRGQIVALKTFSRKGLDLPRSLRKELQQMRDLRHENIVPFVGAIVEQSIVCLLTTYCARGSLEDVLRNQDLPLDNMFAASLVSDLIKGMLFLHGSPISSHGNLKSSNCLVDSRWVLQISGFGLHYLRNGLTSLSKSRLSDKPAAFWRAPELLRMARPPPQGTQSGDVYSFAIILYEIWGRSGPWGHTNLTPDEIIERVVHPALYDGTLFRPNLNHLNCSEYISRCIKECWDEVPENRPDFSAIRQKLRPMQAGLKPNIFDNMLAMMEKYAYNLESLVQERTDQLEEEKKKTEALLHRMLPKSVAESLKRGEPVKAESFDCVTIYFSDIVGFTTLSANSSPMEVVHLLNSLYTNFDSIIESYDVYKVETIGDAYMVVSGLPVRNGDAHAAQIASMALNLLADVSNFRIAHRPSENLQLRIGIHSGPVVAGVVGLRMPRYCLFGDTVNTASRMESSGQALKIHISESTKNLLDKLGSYAIEERGWTFIRGKGDMRTFWLMGHKRHSSVHLSDVDRISCDERLKEELRWTKDSGTDTLSLSPENDIELALDGETQPLNWEESMLVLHSLQQRSSTTISYSTERSSFIDAQL